MRFGYSDDLPTAGMILPILVGGIESDHVRVVQSLVDTGADVSAVPEDLRIELGLQPRGRFSCRWGCDREAKYLPTYCVHVSLGVGGPIELEVVSTAGRYFLLGRDALNEFILLANGPGRFFELSK